MRTGVITGLGVVLLGITVALSPVAGFAQSDQGGSAQASAGETTTTEDVVYLRDGRELHGKVVSETRSLVIFEYVDPTLKVKTKLTLLKDNIIKIERDVAVQVQAETPAPAEKPATSVTTSRKSTRTPERSYGAVRTSGAQDVPALYIVPIKGQMGTDVRAEVYKPIVDDIRAHKPAAIIFEMNCKDIEDTLSAKLGEVNLAEIGLLDFENGHELVNLFRNNLRDIPQYVWISDSVGMASTLALSWSNVYMKPTARLGGLIMVLAQSGAKGHRDPNVRAKMYAAWTGGAKAFLEKGGYSLELGTAMIDPEYVLSATWVGREVKWTLDTNGEYIVDGSDEWPTNFTSKMAEDFCISKGTAETLDDLALLLGYREYTVVDGAAQKVIGDYVTNWRRAYQESLAALGDYEKYMSWANGADALKYLGRAKASLESVLSNMKRYKAVEIRLLQEQGIRPGDLIILTEQLTEQIRSIRSRPRNNSSGGGRGPTRGGGASGDGV